VEALAGPPDLRHDARRSLAAILQRSIPETTRELMRTALASERPEIRSELADVLGRLKDFSVLETLIPLLKDPEWRVRWKVLKSFQRLARLGPLPERARTALFDYARDELAAFRQSLLCSQVLVPHPDWEAERVLGQALEEDRAKIEERVFRMLGVLCGRDRMQTIFQRLNSRLPRLKADALEALETLAPKEIAREVVALLESAPAVPSVTMPRETLVDGLAHYGKPWIRACTAYYLGYHPQADREKLLRALLQDRDSAVRETALYAGWLAFRETWRPLLDAALRSRDPVLRRCSQRILQSNGSGEPGRPRGRNGAMLLTVEKVLLLKSAPIFAPLDSEELAALAEIAIEKEYQPDEIIFEEKQQAHHLYIIARGKVEVFHRVDSTEHSIAVLEREECFGEMAILDDEPRSASVRALERTVVIKIDRESFRELINERPQISFAIFKMLSSRLRLKILEVETPPALGTGHHYA
jgi:HEAT repeat protein